MKTTDNKRKKELQATTVDTQNCETALTDSCCQLDSLKYLFGIPRSPHTPYFGIDIDDISKVNVVEDFYDLLKVLNDPDINEFQYTIEDGEWIVHLK